MRSGQATVGLTKNMRNTPLYREGKYRVVRRGDGYLQIGCTIDGRRYRFSGGVDLAEAKAKILAFDTEVGTGWRPGDQKDNNNWLAVARRMWRRHKQNAELRQMVFKLTVPQVYQLLHEANFHCTVSGIAFSRGEKMGPRAISDPWAPSIDRLDNRLGYLPDNVRIVCVAANIAMNAWGFDTLLRLSKGVVRNAAASMPEQPTFRAVADTAPRVANLND